MNTLIFNNPLGAPHLFQNPHLNPIHTGLDSLQPPSMATSSASRKRKASEDPDHEPDRMSLSPSSSPSAPHHRLLPTASHRSLKRTRTHFSSGRPLPLPRLLQTLSADELRTLLQNVCDSRPDIRNEIVTRAPRPSVESTLAVLQKYETAFRDAFPLGNRPTSDYSYNRVRQHLSNLLEALRDFTPYYLPPQETSTRLSLTYLDAVTDMVHRLPDWDTPQHQRHKHDAYDEIGKAWALVIREAGKTAGGFRLAFGGWDAKLAEHGERSEGRMEEALLALREAVGFSPMAPGVSAERAAVRQSLFSGGYGEGLGVGHAYH
ncbi:Tethering factor for nuclear proteasome sts1 [Oleoguttula sp. CCFEE 5521]